MKPPLNTLDKLSIHSSTKPLFREKYIILNKKLQILVKIIEIKRNLAKKKYLKYFFIYLYYHFYY